MSVILTSVGSTYNRGDFTDDNAFLESSIDLSPYAGALGRTPHLIRILDAAGKLATGYLAGVGAGETLGSELVTNGGFDSDTTGWTPENCTIASIAGGQVGNCLELTRVGGNYQLSEQNISLVIYKLYKSSVYVKSGTSGDGACITYVAPPVGDNLFLTSGASSGSWVNRTKYGTPLVTSALIKLRGQKQSDTVGTMLFDEFSLKQVADPPSTAVHIVSSLNGTTRAWESIESGFDPNSIASWSIEQVESRRKGGYIFRNHH